MFLGGEASAILWVNGEPLCSPKDFLAMSLGMWVVAFLATIELINFCKSCSTQVLGQASFFESLSKTPCLWATTGTFDVEIWTTFTFSAIWPLAWVCACVGMTGFVGLCCYSLGVSPVLLKRPQCHLHHSARHFSSGAPYTTTEVLGFPALI